MQDLSTKKVVVDDDGFCWEPASTDVAKFGAHDLHSEFSDT